MKRSYCVCCSGLTDTWNRTEVAGLGGRPKEDTYWPETDCLLLTWVEEYRCV